MTQNSTWCVLNCDQSPDFLYHDASTVYFTQNPAEDSTGKPYEFDGIMPPNTKQDDRFTEFDKRFLDPAIEAKKSVFLFGYGPKSAGKTFLLTGGSSSFALRGLIPRTLTKLFQDERTKSQRITVCFFEVYKQKIVDLLLHQNSSTPTSTDAGDGGSGVGCEVILRNGGEVVLDLAEKEVRDESDAYHRLFFGDQNRHFERGTETSRGHCVFLVNIEDPPSSVMKPSDVGETNNTEGPPKISSSSKPHRFTLSFVDLAADDPDASGTAVDAVRESHAALRRMLDDMAKNERHEPKDPLCLVMQSLFEDSSMANACSFLTLRENCGTEVIQSWLEFAMVLRKAMRNQAKRRRTRTVHATSKDKNAGAIGGSTSATNPNNSSEEQHQVVPAKHLKSRYFTSPPKSRGNLYYEGRVGMQLGGAYGGVGGAGGTTSVGARLLNPPTSVLTGVEHSSSSSSSSSRPIGGGAPAHQTSFFNTSKPGNNKHSTKNRHPKLLQHGVVATGARQASGMSRILSLSSSGGHHSESSSVSVDPAPDNSSSMLRVQQQQKTSSKHGFVPLQKMQKTISSGTEPSSEMVLSKSSSTSNNSAMNLHGTSNNNNHSNGTTSNIAGEILASRPPSMTMTSSASLLGDYNGITSTRTILPGSESIPDEQEHVEEVVQQQQQNQNSLSSRLSPTNTLLGMNQTLIQRNGSGSSSFQPATSLLQMEVPVLPGSQSSSSRSSPFEQQDQAAAAGTNTEQSCNAVVVPARSSLHVDEASLVQNKKRSLLSPPPNSSSTAKIVNTNPGGSSGSKAAGGTNTGTVSASVPKVVAPFVIQPPKKQQNSEMIAAKGSGADQSTKQQLQVPQTSYSVHPGTRGLLADRPGFWTPMIRGKELRQPEPRAPPAILSPVEDEHEVQRAGLLGFRSRSVRPRISGTFSVMVPPRQRDATVPTFRTFQQQHLPQQEKSTRAGGPPLRNASLKPRRISGLQTVPAPPPPTLGPTALPSARPLLLAPNTSSATSISAKVTSVVSSSSSAATKSGGSGAGPHLATPLTRLSLGAGAGAASASSSGSRLAAPGVAVPVRTAAGAAAPVVTHSSSQQHGSANPAAPVFAFGNSGNQASNAEFAQQQHNAVKISPRPATIKDQMLAKQHQHQTLGVPEAVRMRKKHNVPRAAPSPVEEEGPEDAMSPPPRTQSSLGKAGRKPTYSNDFSSTTSGGIITSTVASSCTTGTTSTGAAAKNSGSSPTAQFLQQSMASSVVPSAVQKMNISSTHIIPAGSSTKRGLFKTTSASATYATGASSGGGSGGSAAAARLPAFGALSAFKPTSRQVLTTRPGPTLGGVVAAAHQ
ncbi:unnamed protein product [Amoebophrya sp. A120]|nr:unnamed protein product [Amoebophrya sp. A120]|eukprot:GSA120T00018787001.1